MEALESVYEQELTNDDGYKKETDLFVQVTGDNGIIGLSFLSKIDANHFNGKIEERLSKRRSRVSYFPKLEGIPQGIAPNVPSSQDKPDYRRRKQTDVENSKQIIQESMQRRQNKQEKPDVPVKNQKPMILPRRQSAPRMQEEIPSARKTSELKMQSPSGSPLSQRRQDTDDTDSDDSEANIFESDVPVKNQKPIILPRRQSVPRVQEETPSARKTSEVNKQNTSGSPMSQRRQDTDDTDSDISEPKIETTQRRSKPQRRKRSQDAVSGISWGVSRVWKKKEKVNQKPSLAKYMIGVPEEESFVHLQGIDIESRESGNAFEYNPMIKEFLTKYGLQHWLLDPNKATQVEKWAEKNDFYGKVEEAKAEGKRSSKVPPPPPFPVYQKPLPPDPMEQGISKHAESEMEKKHVSQYVMKVDDTNTDSTEISEDQEENLNKTINPGFLQELTRSMKPSSIVPRKDPIKVDSTADGIGMSSSKGHTSHHKVSQTSPPPLPVYRKPQPPAPMKYNKLDVYESEASNKLEEIKKLEEKLDRLSAKWIEANRTYSLTLDEYQEDTLNYLGNRYKVSPEHLQDISRDVKPQSNALGHDDIYEDLTYSSDDQEQFIYTYDSDWE